jgi:hypothetical protein
MNAGKFIDFLKALLDSVPGKIFLIVDGHPVHKAKAISALRRLQKLPGLVRGFFRDPKLSYILN